MKEILMTAVLSVLRLNLHQKVTLVTNLDHS